MNLILFLLLALTASRTGLVQCEEDKEETEADIVSEDALVVTPKAEGEEDPENHGDVAGSGDGKGQANSDLDSTPNSDVKNEEIEVTTKTDTDADTEDLISAFMIIIPLLLTLVIIAVIVCVVMMYRRGRKVAGTKEDPYLDHEDHEKVPMPMFDDDIPSVMELEMEDLENWISKDGGKKVDTGQI